jgi:hypothetical protein
MSTDTNTVKKYTICKYCKGHTHFIDPDVYSNDIYARELEPGKAACGNCIDAIDENLVLRTADPTSPRYQQVLAKRQAELDKKIKHHEQLENIKELNRIAESNKRKYQRLTG